MKALALKKSVLDSFVRCQKANYISLTEGEIAEQVEASLNKIPNLLFQELDRYKNKSKLPGSIFISHTSIYHWSDPKVTNADRSITEEVFNNDILPAFIHELRGFGIEIKYEPGNDYAILEINELKKFCEFEKLKSLT